MAADAPVVEAAPAKVNLFLHVTGRRVDGYHLLDSLVVFAGTGDRISVRPGDGLSLRIDGPFADGLSNGDDNLVLRAARALRDRHAPGRGAEIVLEKNLPVASGIGGGSADAAATLRALCRLWSIPLDTPDLSEIALTLGADVPVCLAGRTVRMQGIGETLLDVPPLPKLSILLVNPGVAVPTPAVFKARTGDFSPPAAWPPGPPGPPGPAEPMRAEAPIAALAGTRNDLQAPAISIQPVIGDVLSALRALPGCRLARMSGSGATCFALFETPAAAESAAEALRSGRPGWWVAAAEIL